MRKFFQGVIFSSLIFICFTTDTCDPAFDFSVIRIVDKDDLSKEFDRQLEALIVTVRNQDASSQALENFEEEEEDDYNDGDEDGYGDEKGDEENYFDHYSEENEEIDSPMENNEDWFQNRAVLEKNNGHDYSGSSLNYLDLAEENKSAKKSSDPHSRFWAEQNGHLQLTPLETEIQISTTDLLSESRRSCSDNPNYTIHESIEDNFSENPCHLMQQQQHQEQQEQQHQQQQNIVKIPQPVAHSTINSHVISALSSLPVLTCAKSL